MVGMSYVTWWKSYIQPGGIAITIDGDFLIHLAKGCQALVESRSGLVSTSMSFSRLNLRL
jgi:hypothetical protein